MISGWVYTLAGKTLPYGTLAVNVIGSLLLGLIMEGSLRSTLLSPELRFGLTVGFMGGFTTFSTFSLESLTLLQQGRITAFLTYIALSLIGCMLATALGMILTKQLV
mgnify:CR=1 FL=1